MALVIQTLPRMLLTIYKGEIKLAKTEFKWDTEEVIAEVMEGEKVKHVVKACMLNDVPWVSIQKTVLTQRGWEVKKNQNFKRDVFKQIAEVL